MNTLYYGDNLKVLREHIKDESVDLIYLDPPFNSNRSYNVLFKDESGSSSDAQITAFDDAWHWGETAERTYQDLIQNAPLNVANMIGALRQFIGTNQMMAYLVMMAARLVELHRVLKPTGSLYLHCDPTASHYLKMILDMIFGPVNYKNEITWKRNFTKKGSQYEMTRFANNTDTILFYTKSDKYKFVTPRHFLSESELLEIYDKVDEQNRRFKSEPIELPAMMARPNLAYEYKGYKPRFGWMMSQDKLEELDKAGKLFFTKNGKPRRKNFMVDYDGSEIDNLWIDIHPLGQSQAEALGYPTQKPLALLERILEASSMPGDIVLDPFSGCGTCIAAAQKLGRQWIGIDITHLAIAMHKSRLKDMFGLEPKKDYQVIGEPEDLAGAQQLARDDRYQFQWWALSLIEARPLGGSEGSKTGKKGADRGVDGAIAFLDDRKGGVKRALVQVKSGHVNSSHIRDLKGTLERENAQIGVFITLEAPTRDMLTEAASAGFYHSEIWDRDYPRVQILSIEELLAGAEVKLPPTPKGAEAFKSAGKVDPEGPKQGELGI
jgi:site-specific DNA-methyltransferase (adenine-specific)